LGTWPIGRDELEEARAEDDEGEAAAEGQEGTPEGAQAAQQSEYGATKTGEDEYVCEVRSLSIETSVKLDTSRLEETDADAAANTTCAALNGAANDGELSWYVDDGLASDEVSNTIALVEGDPYENVSGVKDGRLQLNVDPNNYHPQKWKLNVQARLINEYTELGIRKVRGTDVHPGVTHVFGELYEACAYEKHGLGRHLSSYSHIPNSTNMYDLNEIRKKWPFLKNSLFSGAEEYGIRVPHQVTSGVPEPS
jgi:hypothetical protein